MSTSAVLVANGEKPVSNYAKQLIKEINLKKSQLNLILNGCSVKTDKFFEKQNELAFAKFANKIVAFGYLLEKNFYPKKILRAI